MFRKQFTIKSSVNLRHSDRKALFPASFNACFSAKQQFVRLFVALPSLSTNLCLFTHEKEPLLFQCPPDTTIFPTVYFLWSDAFHDQFPVLFVHSSLLPILQNGSDLMIPGILFDPAFAHFEPNAPVAIGIIGEDEVRYGPVAVGKSLISAMELLQKRRANEKGKAVKILHVHGDSLWEFGSRKSIPKMRTMAGDGGDQQHHHDDGAVQQQQQQQSDNGQSVGQDQQVQQEDVHRQQQCQFSPTFPGGETSRENDTTEEENVVLLQADMDELLKNTFFTTLRYKFGTNGPLPIDAGQFYANYILKSLPPGSKLEIKKTKFKKFSNFLRELSNAGQTLDGGDWVIRLKSVKGVDTIEEVNMKHPLVQSAPELLQNDADSAGISSDAARQPLLLTVRENVFSLTDRVMPIFRPYGFTKGDIVDLNKIRTVLLDYAQKQNLCHDHGKQIELDDTLQPVVQHFLHDRFNVNILVQKMASAMTNAVLVTTTGGKQMVHRGTKTPHVDLKIERRAGNNVVTLVSNLSMFGIDVNALRSEIRGTGTSILATAPACDGPQLLVQGNQITRIGRLLTTFGLPKKFITGLDQGIKESKKKKNDKK